MPKRIICGAHDRVQSLPSSAGLTKHWFALNQSPGHQVLLLLAFRCRLPVVFTASMALLCIPYLCAYVQTPPTRELLVFHAASRARFGRNCYQGWAHGECEACAWRLVSEFSPDISSRLLLRSHQVAEQTTRNSPPWW